MAISNLFQRKIRVLKEEFDHLRKGKDSLLRIIDEAEIPEGVYNSNAIENSTLTLKETEKILLEQDVSRNVSLREVFEAKNLARILGFIRKKSQESSLSEENILLMHKMLLSAIDDRIAGRFREGDEYVRVGTHIAPPPEQLELLTEEVLVEYENDLDSHFLEKIAKFHLEFERIHPFNDGNGRIGRALINYQLYGLQLPPIIIRDKVKKYYYQAFREYDYSRSSKRMERVLAFSLMLSLHKRITYLKGQKIITVVEHSKLLKKSAQAHINAANRQSIPAFIEKGVWRIGVDQDFKI